jgi:phosphomannomutase / phosphoglucomutase
MSAKTSPVDQFRQWVQTHPWQTATLLFGLFALWFAYSAFDVYSQNQTERSVLAARDQAAAQIAPKINTLQQSMLTAQKKLEPLPPAMLDETIALAFKEAVAGNERVEVYSTDMSTAYASIAKFGAGKLAVLESGINDEGVAMRVAKVAGSPKVLLAKSVGADSAMKVVLVQLPMSVLDNATAVALPSKGFIAVRQGQFDILTRGDTALAHTAEMNASKLAQTPWRIVASAPLAEKGLFEAKGIGEAGLFLLFLLASMACWFGPAWLHKRRHGAAVFDEEPGSELTLQEIAEQVRAKPAAESAAVPVFNIKETVMAKVPLQRGIFRAYDIRGIVGTNLDPGIARLIGEVIGSILIEKGLKGIVVGYDGRLSSPSLAQGLMDGLASAGVTVLDLGCVATPVVYFASHKTDFTSGISVTGSHNPPDYNGFKIVIDGHTLSGDAITNIFDRIVEKRIIQAKAPGVISKRDIVPEYIRHIADDIQIDRPLKVVVDCGNGVPGAIAPALLRAIGAEVEELYCEVDGNFPNHHPDPSDPHNLIDLINLVKHENADLGLAFDGDGDRLGVVTAQGEMIFPDRLLMLFAEDVLNRHPGAAIIYDVKCTGALQGHILRHGGSPIMWKTGHSLIKAKMKETHAELAGEMSGHFFFAERWFGFDDGMYAAARLLEILAASPEGIQSLFDALPKPLATPELKIELNEGEQHAFIERFVAQAQFEGARINLIDGVRADWPDGWGLVRASNTTPVLVVRFEAHDEAAMSRIQNLFRAQLLALDAELKLPF